MSNSPVEKPVEKYAYDEATGEHQVFGAPGTGKSTYLTRQIRHAAEKYGSNEIIVTSFTRAAATELVGRNLPIKSEQVATLHAHCYRAIGKPRLVETDKELIKQWNDQHAHWTLGTGHVDIDDPLADEVPQGAGAGDEVFAKYQLLRARMVDWRMFPMVRNFAEAWEDFKRQTGSIDFTDMISLALERIPTAPTNPAVMFVDEAQDMTALEWSVVRKWGAHTQHFIVAGDDDQCIYEFKGASAETFFETDLPDERKHVLQQSHRVPAVVHAMANRWIEGLTKRKAKVYRPRVDQAGRIVEGEYRWLGDADFLRVRKMVEDAEQYLSEGKSVMFLATCAYMLSDLKNELRVRGHVFHNPYRKKRGDWNPLGRGKGIEALLSFLAPQLRGLGQIEADKEGWRKLATAHLWTRTELLNWLNQLSVSGFLKRGAVKQIEGTSDYADDGFFGTQFDDWLKDVDELIKMANGDLNWFLDHVSKANEKKYEYLCSVARNKGHKALTEQPKIIIGTIHSVKGGEADVVYLMPDLSRRGYDAWHNHATRDSVIRQMYVGMTRCREALVITNPATEYYIKGLHRV